MKDPLVALEDWFLSTCNGDWEHDWGAQIHTLDNPGWSLKVNLEGTELEERTFHEIKVDRDENDWLRCWVEKKFFYGCGGPKNLSEILRLFTEWV